jgi:DNA replication protein DnaC
MESALNRINTYFITCHDLIIQLKKSFLENRLEQKLRRLSSYSVLIIDEVGYLPLDIEASNLLFQLITKRYEKKTTIITTNKNFSEWGEVFGDTVLANAILDRLLHHSKVFTIKGRSYRTKDIMRVNGQKPIDSSN